MAIAPAARVEGLGVVVVPGVPVGGAGLVVGLLATLAQRRGRLGVTSAVGRAGRKRRLSGAAGAGRGEPGERIGPALGLGPVVVRAGLAAEVLEGGDDLGGLGVQPPGDLCDAVQRAGDPQAAAGVGVAVLGCPVAGIGGLAQVRAQLPQLRTVQGRQKRSEQRVGGRVHIPGPPQPGPRLFTGRLHPGRQLGAGRRRRRAGRPRVGRFCAGFGVAGFGRGGAGGFGRGDDGGRDGHGWQLGDLPASGGCLGQADRAGAEQGGDLRQAGAGRGQPGDFPCVVSQPGIGAQPAGQVPGAAQAADVAVAHRPGDLYP
jgi:hypothetical protein